MEKGEMIISIIRREGPLLPAKIAKEIKVDLMYAQAYLAELTSKKTVRISNVKVGGSPLYYLPGQESALQSFSDKLGEKDKETYELLKNNKVLRESEQTPLVRVSLKALKDFAKPIDVKFNGTQERFWKWYLCSNEDITPIVKEMMDIEKKETEPIVKEQPKETQTEQPVKKQLDPPVQNIHQPPKSQPIEPLQTQQSEPTRLTIPQEQSVQASTQQIPSQNTQPHIPVERTQKTLPRSDVPDDDEFFKQLKQFFYGKNIEVISSELVRKNAEVDLLIQIHSPIGKVKFFCNARNKKKCNDGDLSMAYVKGLNHHLPTLFLTTGEVTKKALDMIDSHFKGLLIQTIEGDNGN